MSLLKDFLPGSEKVLTLGCRLTSYKLPCLGFSIPSLLLSDTKGQGDEAQSKGWGLEPPSSATYQLVTTDQVL